jgi:hypothetical protein
LVAGRGWAQKKKDNPPCSFSSPPSPAPTSQLGWRVTTRVRPNRQPYHRRAGTARARPRRPAAQRRRPCRRARGPGRGAWATRHPARPGSGRARASPVCVCMCVYGQGAGERACGLVRRCFLLSLSNPAPAATRPPSGARRPARRPRRRAPARPRCPWTPGAGRHSHRRRRRPRRVRRSLCPGRPLAGAAWLPEWTDGEMGAK